MTIHSKTQTANQKQSKLRDLRTLRTLRTKTRSAEAVHSAQAAQAARSVRAAHPVLLVLFALGSALLAFSCALASNLTGDTSLKNFEETLSYPENNQFIVGSEGTFRPTTVPDTDKSGISIRYSISRQDKTALSAKTTIDEINGAITIDSTADSGTDAGTTSYIVLASADGFVTQMAVLNITILEDITIQGSTYHSEATDVFPIEIGQAIEDSGMFSLAGEDALFAVSGLVGRTNYVMHFGSDVDNYDQSYQRRTSEDGYVAILKSEADFVRGLNTLFSSFFVDGTVAGISGPGITDILHIATYRPSNIYNHQDLQAMRSDLSRDYVLKNDIEFTPTGTAASNYEAVGTDSNPFTGSLDGAGYAITGVEIVDTDNYQGLFGVVEAAAADTVIAQNLVLRNFKITANAYVGSLAGSVNRGTVDNVSVEVDTPDAGKVEITGSVDEGGTEYGFGGGLFGFAGADATSIEVIIQNTSSAVAVLGTGTSSSRIGGLVGDLNNASISGYVTGSVRGNNAVGGLVGISSASSIVAGYVTGLVRGSNSVGGLIGISDDSSVVTGYAIGDVIGSNEVGGLVGTNRGNLSGYARGAVRRGSGSGTDFGKTTGSVSVGGGTVKTYSSADNQVYDGETGTTVLASTTGEDGTVITITGSTEATLSQLTFSANLGEWTWVENGKWPAINIGDVKPASEQPVDP